MSMRPVLFFTPSQAGRETVKLGEALVGEVAERAGAAVFVVWLPDVPSAFRPAQTVRQARRRVVDTVEEWLVRVGIFYPGESVVVRAPADPDLTTGEAAE